MKEFYQEWNMKWQNQLKKNRIRWVANESRDVMENMFRTTIKEIITYSDSADIILNIKDVEVKIKRKKNNAFFSSFTSSDPWVVTKIPKKIGEEYGEKLKTNLDEMMIETMISQIEEEIVNETMVMKNLLGCEISDISPTPTKRTIVAKDKQYVFFEKNEKIQMLTNCVYLMGLGNFLRENGFTIGLRQVEKDYGKTTDQLIRWTVEEVLNGKEKLNFFDGTNVNFQPIFSYVKEKVGEFEKSHLIGEYNGFHIYERDDIKNTI